MQKYMYMHIHDISVSWNLDAKVNANLVLHGQASVPVSLDYVHMQMKTHI